MLNTPPPSSSRTSLADAGRGAVIEAAAISPATKSAFAASKPTSRSRCGIGNFFSIAATAAAGSSLPSASCRRALASGAASRLKRMTCGSMIAWVSACGRPRPPSTCASLWCSAVPELSTVPASQAPMRHSPRAATLAPSATTAGRFCPNRRIASVASPTVTGVRLSTHSASTQWAMAFMPLAALTAAGRPSVRSGS